MSERALRTMARTSACRPHDAKLSGDLPRSLGDFVHDMLTLAVGAG